MPDSGSPIRSNTKSSFAVQAQDLFDSAERSLRLRQVEAAISAYQAAECLGYDADRCAGARWIAHMLLGDYQSAWKESASIESRGGSDPHRFWDGRPLGDRHVLIRCLHGLGDTLQYVRYVPLLRKQAASVILEPQPALKCLLSQSALADVVITWKEPEPPWDAQIEIVELPRIFETSLATIPPRVPYLRAPRTEITLAKNKLHVGLVWGSGAFNPARCIPLRTLGQVCNTPGCEFFSFQAGNAAAELAGCGAPIRDLEERDGSVLQTAGKLLNMDLLITVDTMQAHLAGALGIPVWTLLPFEADWRWMVKRDDSPWYPTMRLFRQSHAGDWEAVVHCLQRELTAVAAQAA